MCDDSFEEHVLPYGPDKTGLHLHGLNESTKEFRTMPQDIVDAFAKEWGFIVTASTVLKSLAEVKSFTEQIGQKGEWRGEPLEGFVVRTHVGSGDLSDRAAPPYAPGSSLFFKVKFDEPYMMYRDWREVTKMLLTKGPSTSHVPKAKLRRPETRTYVNWVIEEIKRDRKPFADYTKGKGIIATRERFLKWLESEEGRKAIESSGQPQESLEQNGKTYGKTIIVPVAIPGCGAYHVLSFFSVILIATAGKTSIAVALVYLFGFGHTQSDDVHVKKAAPVFIKNVVNLLKTHDVVIADK